MGKARNVKPKSPTTKSTPPTKELEILKEKGWDPHQREEQSPDQDQDDHADAAKLVRTVRQTQGTGVAGVPETPTFATPQPQA